MLSPEQLAEIQTAMQDTLASTLGTAVSTALAKCSDINRLKRKNKQPKEFKRKGNQLRYEANEEVLEKLEDAMDLVESKGYEDATATLEEGKKLILKQQKHIKIADREPDGWDVVKHYVSDDLADDSADEKALKKARKQVTKVMRPFSARWRGRGIKTVLYLDDGLGAKGSFQSALTAGRRIRTDLESAGFFLNEQKSDFHPTQHGTWLGMNLDTVAMKFVVPPEKVAKLKSELQHLIKNPLCTAKRLSQLTGKLSSMSIAIAPLVRLFTRHLYRQIESRRAWFEQEEISHDSMSELVFWSNNIDYFNGLSFKPMPTTSKIVFTDASGQGWGGFTLHRLEKLVCHGRFTEGESQESSTYRELLAVKFVLESYGDILAN